MAFKTMTLDLEKEIIKAYISGETASKILEKTSFKTTKTIYDILKKI